MSNNDTSMLPKSFTTPWTLRAFDALPGNPFWKGIGFTISLLVLFLVGRSLAGDLDSSSSDNLRVTVTQILIMTYGAFAFAYLLDTIRKTTHELAQASGSHSRRSYFIDRATKHPWWLLASVGAASYLIVGVAVTNSTTPDTIDPWAWRLWNYDYYWQRATTVFASWWIGCLCYVIVVESARLSEMSDNIESLDLLELHPFRPLIRQGLTNALLVIVFATIMSLLGVEARYGPVLAAFWIASLLLAWVGMMLPLRGIRRKITVAKNHELDWCRQALKTARDDLKNDVKRQKSIAEIVAYKSMIENIRNWPFDNATLVRFMLYLLIPLGSWLGGALVERGLDSFLS